MAFTNVVAILVGILCSISVRGNPPPPAAAQGDKHEKHWGYTSENGDFDQFHWKDVSRYCNNKIYEQSPINIETSGLTYEKSVCDPFKQLDIHFVNSCKDGTFTGLAKNNGHSLVITPVEYFPQRHGYVKLNKENNVIMELSNFWNYNLGIQSNQYYCFDSFHFHWGRFNNGKGSEHTINGEQFPLEAHFVHYSCDYDNIGQALSKWRLGGNIGVGPNKKDVFVLGVVGVFFQIGAPNPTLARIFDRFDKLKTLNSKELIQGIDLNDLLPRDKAYYTYEGSLTTPPCFPVVLWHILKEPMTVSEEQMKNLQQLLNTHGQPEGDNYREIETNPNPVYDCGQTAQFPRV